MNAQDTIIKQPVAVQRFVDCKMNMNEAQSPGLEILACPYCHKTTEDKDRCTRAVTATTYTENHACVVQCNWCGLSGPVYKTTEEAIAAWNGLPRKSPNAAMSEGFKVPLLGIPPDAVLEECDCCHEHFGMSKLSWTGKQMLCAKCAESPNAGAKARQTEPPANP